MYRAAIEPDIAFVVCRARQVFNLMSQLPGLHPDSVLYRTIVNTFSACLANKMVLDVVLLMREQVGKSPRVGLDTRPHPTVYSQLQLLMIAKQL